MRTTCPDWCAGGHHCTAQLGSGGHASTPEVWDTDTGRVVATRRCDSDGSWLELRITISLRGDMAEHITIALMRYLVAGIHHSIGRMLGRRWATRSRRHSAT